MDRYFNHVMRKAIMSFALMFGLLFAIATAIVWYLEMPLSIGITVAVVTVVLQYTIGPLIIPLLFKIEFGKQTDHLKPEVLEFIKRVCTERRLPVPKIGVIQDGNPNAFVYGHFKWDARLVVTTGLLDVLDEDEQKAVIAHEIGHIKNHDFVLMMVVSVIPLIMYQIYAGTRNNKENLIGWIGLGAYAVYIFSQFVVLAFSRVREFYADNFSKQIIGDGQYLKSALIKIAYGFTKIEKKKKLRSSTIGIANAAQSEAFMLLNYCGRKKNQDVDRILLGWDLRNIWGKWYEIASTHPLTAKRVLALSGEKIEGSITKIEDVIRFLVEVFIKILPWAMIAMIAVPGITKPGIYSILASAGARVWSYPVLLVLLGASILIRYYYSYSAEFAEYNIEQLLLREDASPVKGIPAVIKGKIIGRGIPGLFWSEDVVLEDETGIMLVDYRQPLRFLEFLFGLLKVEDMNSREATITGWYKRDLRPYFACKHIVVEGKKYASYNYILNQLLGYAVVAAGIILIAARYFI